MAVGNLLTVPLIGFLYLLSPQAFVSRTATLSNGNDYQVPEKGLPTWWATIYAANSVCWGDYTFLDFDHPLRIEFIQFPVLWFWGLW